MIEVALVGVDDPNKLWIGLRNPCDSVDMDIFYLHHHWKWKHHSLFRDSLWVNGMKPIDIAPFIFEASRRKKWTVKALC